MKAKISERGQVTIPKKLRDQFDIRVGDELDFEADGGRIVVRKVVAQDRFDAVWGTLTLPTSVNEAVDEMRGPAVPPLEGEL